MESKFTRDVCKGLERAGCEIIVISGNRFCRNKPDRLVWSWYGKWLIEFKGPTTKYKLAQKLNAEKLDRKSNYSVFVAREPGELYAADGEELLDTFTTGEELFEKLKRIERWSIDNGRRQK